MKTLFKSLLLLTILAFSFAPALVRAQDDGDDQDVSFQTFYDQLSSQGNWIQTDDYGYVFQPNVGDDDWAPYTDGSWVDSPAGFTWVSDEPWGWATYHYGRWANINGLGWVWVPGYRWAPAWVSWRYGGDYCGWAPLPPETLYGAEYGDSGVDIGIGFHFGGDVDVSFGIGPECYNFIRVEDLGGRDYRRSMFHRDRNFEIINHTTNITNLNVHHGGRGHRFDDIAAGGPPLNEVNARSRQHIQTVNFTAAHQPGQGGLAGNSLAVFAPTVDPGSLHQARPSRVERTINHPTFNHGNSVTQPLEVTANLKPAPLTPAEIQAAHDAELHAPATGKIATSQTPITSTFSKPLSSLTPVTHNPSNGNGEHHSDHHTFNNTGGPGNNPETQTHTFAPPVENNGGAPAPSNPGNGGQGNGNDHRSFNSQNQNDGGAVHHDNQTQNNGGSQGNGDDHHFFNSQNQNDGGAVHHDNQTQNNGGGQGNGNDHRSFNSQNQNDGGAVHHDNQTQNNGGGQGNGNDHRSFNSQNQNDGGAVHHDNQTQNNGGGFKPEDKPAHTFAPQNQGGGGGGGGNPGGNHSSGGQGGENHASGGQGGGNKPADAGGKPSGDTGKHDSGKGDNKDKDKKP